MGKSKIRVSFQAMTQLMQYQASTLSVQVLVQLFKLNGQPNYSVMLRNQSYVEKLRTASRIISYLFRGKKFRRRALLKRLQSQESKIIKV